MEITTQWLDPDETVLLEVIPPKWTTEDYYRLVDRAAALLATKTHTVHIIGDFRASKTPPRQISQGAHYAEKRLPPNQGVIVFVAPGPFITAYIHIATRLRFAIVEKLFVAETMPEAYAILQREANVDLSDIPTT